MKKVWFSGRRGWAHCFVQRYNNVAENELIDFSSSIVVPVRGLSCSLWNFNPLTCVNSVVIRYGHQPLYKARGYIHKYCTGTDYTELRHEEGGDPVRFSGVFLVLPLPGQTFSQGGDSGGPVILELENGEPS